MLIYKNHYGLNKNLNIFLGNHNCIYFRRRCLNFYRSQNVTTKHRERCNKQDITSTGTSNESHLYWKEQFHNNPLHFEKYADFEADNEIDSTHRNK